MNWVLCRFSQPGTARRKEQCEHSVKSYGNWNGRVAFRQIGVKGARVILPRRLLQSLSFLLSAALAVIACRLAAPEQRYGFIARLGRDTISVESVTRRGNSVVVDGVDRFPRVRR